MINFDKKGKEDVFVFLKEGENIDLEINLLKSGADVSVFLVHLTNDGKAKINLRINHLAKNTKSEAKIRIVIFGDGKSDIVAFSDVAKNGLGSEIKLFSEAILLGSNSSVSFIPSVSSLNNDVAISHGANTEIFNKEKIFYLSSRGVSEKEAIKTFIESFLSPLTSIENKEINETVGQYLDKINV